MSESKFYTKKGLLTPYGLACGYIEKSEINGRVKQLYREHDCYHVQLFDHNTMQREVWESFPISEPGGALTKARKLYFSLK